MESLAKDFEKVVKRQRLLKNETEETIDTILKKLSTARSTTEQGADSSRPLTEIKEVAAKLTESYKDMQGVLHKYGKAVEKRFKTDLDNIWDTKALEGKADVVNRMLAIHFVREGRFDTADTFSKDSGVQISAELKSQFFEMY